MVSGIELLDRPHSHWGSPCKSTHEQSPNSSPPPPTSGGTLGLFCRYPGQLLQSQVSAGNPGVAGSQREVKSQKAPGHRSTATGHFTCPPAALPSPSLGLRLVRRPHRYRTEFKSCWHLYPHVSPQISQHTLSWLELVATFQLHLVGQLPPDGQQGTGSVG